MSYPQRMCVSCRNRFNKQELIRISRHNEEPVIDMNKQQTSRAIYVCKNAKCIDILKKSKVITRLLKIEVKEEFFENLKNYININD